MSLLDLLIFANLSIEHSNDSLYSLFVFIWFIYNDHDPPLETDRLLSTYNQFDHKKKPDYGFGNTSVSFAKLKGQGPNICKPNNDFSKRYFLFQVIVNLKLTRSRKI